MITEKETMSEKNSDSKVFKETVGLAQDRLSFKTTPKIMVLLSIALLMVALGATAAFWAFKQIKTKGFDTHIRLI